MAVIELVLSLAGLLVALAAVVHAHLLVKHRRDDLTPWQMWMPGSRFYQASSFKPSGHALQRRFVILVVAFVGLWIARTVFALAS